MAAVQAPPSTTTLPRTTAAGTTRARHGISPSTSAPRRSPCPNRRRMSWPLSATPGSDGLRVAAQGTGHSAAPLGELEDTLLVKTSRMRRLTVDPVARTARAEAGVVWLQVAEAAAEHGLAGLAGSSPDIGVVGYTLAAVSAG